jgi:predicted naringenin-chalcone synthase
MLGLCEIDSFNHVLPKNIYQQSDITNWMAEYNLEKGESASLHKKRFERFSVSPDKIAKRGLEFLDISSLKKRDYDQEKNTKEFSKRADEVFDLIYKNVKKAPDHLIHVSCTGYESPSAPQIQINKKEWQGKTNVTQAYHMGCYAAAPAIRTGCGMIAMGDKQVDIVHNEMSSLHQNPEMKTPEQILIHSLFADGHIKYSISPVGTLNKGYRLLKIKEQIIPNSLDQMQWSPTSWGHKMALGKEVPSLIAKHINTFIEELAPSIDLKDTIFAIHPGGPKIIDLVAEKLNLSEEQVQQSREVLRDHGNMSSATLPHVWERVFNENYSSGKKMISLAFGPGLTVFGLLFELI